jgi:hypothetical protein
MHGKSGFIFFQRPGEWGGGCIRLGVHCQRSVEICRYESDGLLVRNSYLVFILCEAASVCSVVAPPTE